jgi:hypothetical protein
MDIQFLPEKIFSFHTPVGLFVGRKLIYFSVLYHSIGEISGNPSGEEYIQIQRGNIFRNSKTFQNRNSKSPSPPEK